MPELKTGCLKLESVVIHHLCRKMKSAAGRLAAIPVLLLALLGPGVASGADWAKNYGSSTGNAYTNTQTIDAAGNVYIAGYFTGSTFTLEDVSLTRIGSQDAFVAKLDSSGTVLWAKNFGGSGATVYGKSIAVDSSGNVYLGGYFSGSNLTTPALSKIGNQDTFAIKLDSSGNTTWAKNFGGSIAYVFVQSIAVDNSGNIYLGGYFQAANLTTPALTKIGSTDAFAIKLDSSGNITWGKNFGGSMSGAYCYSISVDGSGNVYLGGVFNSADLTTPALTRIGSQDAYVLKLDSSGNTTWAKNFGGIGVTPQGRGIVVDGSGNVYLGGSFNGANLTTPAITKIGNQDAFVLKLDSSGNTTWAKNFGGSGTTTAFVSGIAVDGSGNVFLGGYFTSANFTTPAMTKIGTYDVFAIKLDPSGATTWAKNYGGSGASAYGSGIAVDGSGNLYLGGYFNGANLTTPALTKIGATDAFILGSDAASPMTTATPAGGTYTSTQSVPLTCSDGTGSGCDKIYYTTDGSTPTTSSPIYSGPITISATMTLKFFAKDLAGNSEAVKTEVYTITDPLAYWSHRTSGTTNHLYGITYGNGTYVAVGGSGTLVTSSDGSNWTARSFGISNDISSVTYGNSTFAAVGTAETIMTSSDGINWSLRSSAYNNNFNSVSFCNNRFVAVGYDGGKVMVSTDGISWTVQNTGNSIGLSDVAYGNGHYVVVGWQGTIVTSEDGVSWTSRVSGVTEDLLGVTYNGSLFVAVGGIGGASTHGTILTSSDGITWVNRSPSVSQILNDVIFGNGQFVAVGTNRTILTSTDGVSWTAQPSGLSTIEHLYDVVYAGSRFTIIGTTGTIMQSGAIPDITPPTGTISITSGAAYTNTTITTLTLSCTDDSGCLQMQFSNDNTTWSTAETYLTTKAWTLSSGDGTKTVYVKFKDTAGNWSTVTINDTIVLDTTAPTTTASPAGGAYISSKLVVLSANESATIYYTTDGTTPTMSSPVYVSTIPIATSKVLKFFAIDSAGNAEAVKTANYNINPIASWTRSIGAQWYDVGFRAATDNSGNIYVTGYSSGTAATSFDGNAHQGMDDVILVKYDASGIKLWSRLLGTEANEWPWGAVTDNDGNVYIAGYTYGDLDGNTNNFYGSGDIFLTKYDGNGNKLWTNQFGTTGDDNVGNMTTDGNGNIYISGIVSGSLDGNAYAGSGDAFLAKFDVNGNRLLTIQFGTSAYDAAGSVTVDKSGNLYIVGTTEGGLDVNTNAGNWDAFLVKYDPSGNKIWTRQFGSSSWDYVSGVKVDDNGNIYVSGMTSGGFDGNANIGGEDIFLVKFDSNGNRLWTRQAGTSADDETYDMAMDKGGNVYVAGHTAGNFDGNINAGAFDILLLKYDAAGNKMWTKQFGTSGSDEAYGIALAPNADIFITGGTYGTLDGNANSGQYDLFLVKLPSNDTIPPSGTISINSGAASTNSSSATLTLSCTDSGGCSEMRFSNDNATWSTAESYATNKAWTLVSGDGTKTVYVKYKDTAGNWSSAYSDTITLTSVDSTSPSSPSNIEVNNPGVKGQLVVSWTNPADADFSHIYIFRSTTSGTLGTKIADNLTGIKYTDTGLASLTTYYYTVRAVDNAGNESINTAQVSAKTSDATPPAVPGSMTAVDATTGGKINLSWTNPIDSDLSMIKVYRSTVSGTLGSGVFIGLATSYSDTGLTNGTAYYYTIRAVDTSNNETTNTTQVSATPTAPDTTAPAVPTTGGTPVVNTQAGGTLTISWTNPIDPDFAYVRIYRSTTSGVLGALVYDNVTGTSKTDTGLTNNATYYYTIRSVDTAGNESTNTNQVSGMPTDIQVPKNVTGLTTTLLANGQIRLDWTRSSSTDVNAYNIYSDNGTGTIDYAFTHKVGTVQHPTTTWTSGNLTVGTAYKFAVRAEDAAQNEEPNTSVVASAVPVTNPNAGDVKGYIKVPQTGQKISGNRVTVVADLLTGASIDVKNMRFQYKPALSGSWTDITPPDPAFPNPDTTNPWFTHWDVTSLATGDYLIRAIATNVNLAVDSNPSYITVTVDNTTPQVTEGANQKSQDVSSNTPNKVSMGTDSGITQVTISEGALSADTKVNVTAPDPSTKNSLVPAGTGKANEFREITLDSGQTSLSNNKTADVVIPYKDDNNDGIVDGTITKVYDLKVMRYDTSTSSWDKLDSVVDTTTKTVKGQTNHFTLFGLLAPPNPTTPGWNIVAVPLNPSPNSASSVFGQTPYVYNPTTSGYDRPSTIQPGIGYWIKGGANLTATGTETPTAGNFSITLKKGWNMIGNPFRFKVKLSDCKVLYNTVEYTMADAETNGYLVGTAYPYVNGAYQFVNASDGGTLEPWVGYWILSDKDCTMLVPPTPAQ